MYTWSLKFHNEFLEKSYQLENTPFIVSKFVDFFRIQIVFVLISSLYQAITNFKGGIHLIILSFFLIIIGFMYLIRNRFKSLFIIMILISCMGIGVMFVEFARLSMTNPNEYVAEGFLLVICFQLYMSLLLLTKANWVYISIFYLLNFLYLLFRLIDFSSLRFPVNTYAGIIFIIMNYLIMAYKQEKTTRELFYNKEKDHENLRNFKHLLQNILPYPIFIANKIGKKIEFMNESAHKIIEKQLNPSPNSPILENSNLKSLKNDGTSEFDIFIDLLDSFKVVDKENNLINEKKNNLYELISNQYDQKSRLFSDFNLDNTHIMFTTLNLIAQPKSSESDFLSNEKSNVRNYFELKFARIIWENNICLLVILFDNSNLIKLKQLENLDKYKTRMISTISHDLRTPLNGIMGMISSVITQIKEKEIKKMMKIGIISTHILNYLINDILDFTLISNGSLKLNFEVVVLRNMINEVISYVKIQAKKKNIILKTIINTIHHRIYSDQIRIKQILLNLLTNSLKYTAQQGIISIKIIDESPSIIKFIVEDTGIGIKPEQLEKLFSLFGSMESEDDENESTFNKTGVGLGLTVSNNIAKKLCKRSKMEKNGLFVDSQYLKGTKFWFFIDVGEISSETDIEENEGVFTKNKLYESKRIPTMKMLEIRESKIKILIVDDDLVNLMVLEKYMNFYGLKYLTAMNGEEAINVIKSDEGIYISCVLMDCNMPVMDGFVATEKINEFLKNEGRKMIPIVAVTANVTITDKELCLKCGMIKCLTKPISRQVIALTLNELLDLKLG